MPAEQIFAGIFLFPQKRSVAILPNLVTSTAQRKEPKGTYPCILGSSANDPWVIHHVPKDRWPANLGSHISRRKTCLKIPLISSPYTLYIYARVKGYWKGATKQVESRYKITYFASQFNLFRSSKQVILMSETTYFENCVKVAWYLANPSMGLLHIRVSW